jgi:hypothetical protein
MSLSRSRDVVIGVDVQWIGAGDGLGGQAGGLTARMESKSGTSVCKQPQSRAEQRRQNGRRAEGWSEPARSPQAAPRPPTLRFELRAAVLISRRISQSAPPC